MNISKSNPVEKVCRILLAITDPASRRLTGIVDATGLNKVTVLRVLESLRREGLIEKNEDTKTYHYGKELRLIASSLAEEEPLQTAARDSARRLAEESGDVVTLFARSGWSSLCVDHAVGEHPRHRRTLSVGSRRPLGVGAGPTAILSWLDEEERHDAIANIEPYLRPYRQYYSVPAILESVSNTIDRGYCFSSNTLIKGAGAIGMPVLDPDRRVVGALCISSDLERLGREEERLATMLWQESMRIREKLSRVRPSRARSTN